MEYRLDELFHAQRVVFNVPLRKLTTFRIGGNAEAVISPMCVDDVLESLKIVNDNEIPYFVMGNGSNILACDRGYKGVILRFDRFMSQIAFDENDKVTAMSGTKLNMIFDFFEIL
jgi:UDP-N-acetylmuramate dehydrogenase